jgi:hypothetical protein
MNGRFDLSGSTVFMTPCPAVPEMVSNNPPSAPSDFIQQLEDAIANL